MLLTKKLIHLIKFATKKENQIIFNGVFYYNIINPKYILVYFSNLFYLKNQFLNKIDLECNYKIKLVSEDKSFLNSKLLELATLLSLISFKVKTGFSVLKTNNRFYTLLRSPFVNKKSREQLNIEKNTGLIVLKLEENNKFYTEFLDKFFSLNALSSKSMKVSVLKITS